MKGGVHERREQRAAEMVGWLVAAAAGDVETAQLILHSCDKACVSAQDHHVRPQCLVSVCLYVRTVCFVFVSLCCFVLCVWALICMNVSRMNGSVECCEMVVSVVRS